MLNLRREVASHRYKNTVSQVKVGNVLEVDGKLVQVIKSVHGAGQARQLGNVQVRLHLHGCAGCYGYHTLHHLLIDMEAKYSRTS